MLLLHHQATPSCRDSRNKHFHQLPNRQISKLSSMWLMTLKLALLNYVHNRQLVIAALREKNKTLFKRLRLRSYLLTNCDLWIIFSHVLRQQPSSQRAWGRQCLLLFTFTRNAKFYRQHRFMIHHPNDWQTSQDVDCPSKEKEIRLIHQSELFKTAPSVHTELIADVDFFPLFRFTS